MPEKTIAEEAGLPPSWQPLDAPPIIPGQPAPGPPYTAGPPLLQGSLPPLFQHDVSFVATEIKSPNVPGLSLMPLGVQGNPSSNAGIQSTSTTVIQEANNEAPPDIDYYQTVKRNSSPFTQRPALNFSTDFTVGDSSPNNDTEIGITFPTDTDFYQTVQRNASSATQRPKLNFSTDFTVADDSGNTSTDIGITFPTDTDFYQTVQQAGTSRTQRAKLNFIAPLTATDNSGNGSTDIAITGSALGPPITANYYQALSGTVSITDHTSSVIDSIAVTMPSSGGPWRALVSYTYYKSGGVDYSGWVTDGLGNGWAAADYVTQNNLTSLQGSGFSPVTYANGATVTFFVNIYDTGNSTIELVSQVFSASAAVSYMQVSIMASN
jgi:hypothetical protein